MDSISLCRTEDINTYGIVFVSETLMLYSNE